MADLSYHPEAKIEIREAAAFYQRRRNGLGEEMLLERCVELGRQAEGQRPDARGGKSFA